MNTKAAALLAGAIVLAAIIVSFSLGGGDPAPEAGHEGAGESSSAATAGGGAARDPALQASNTEQQLAQLQRELAAARDEIKRMKDRSRGDAAPVGTAPRTPAQQKALAERFFKLGKAYSSGTATKEEAQELLRLSRDEGLMKLVVTDLEARIAENPDDLEARLQLVDVQSARVHSAESIVERAALRDGVRTQLGEVLKRDPDNWDARYISAVGISHSQRTPQGRAKAIGAFESLIKLQQGQPAEPRFAKTYGQLAGMHLQEKDVAKARAAVTAGLARYPDSEELRKMLEALPREGN